MYKLNKQLSIYFPKFQKKWTVNELERNFCVPSGEWGIDTEAFSCLCVAIIDKLLLLLLLLLLLNYFYL